MARSQRTSEYLCAGATASLWAAMARFGQALIVRIIVLSVDYSKSAGPLVITIEPEAPQMTVAYGDCDE